LNAKIFFELFHCWSLYQEFNIDDRSLVLYISSSWNPTVRNQLKIHRTSIRVPFTIINILRNKESKLILQKFYFIFILTYRKSFRRLPVDLAEVLRGIFFQCRVFAMQSVQNQILFWRSSQNYFVLALFCSLHS
jgi:uncharacterized membrane protein (DUF485 family)